MKITVIGCGNCGSALVRALLEARGCSPQDILVIQRSEKRRMEVEKEFKVQAVLWPPRELSHQDALLVAVKPQDFKTMSAPLAKLLPKNQLVLTIMAGMPINVVHDGFPSTDQIVRAMPNLPMRIRQGIIPFIGSPQLSEENKTVATKVFTACGKPFPVDEEWKIDAATAVSGSGPGFLYYFAEAFLNAAEAIGFSKTEAHELIQTTFVGSSLLWREFGTPVAEMKEQVRSKGGTTDRGYRVFDEYRLSEMMKEAVKAAFERSKELSKVS